MVANVAMIKTLKAKHHGMFGIVSTKMKVKPIHFRIPMDKSWITNQWEILRASPEENRLKPTAPQRPRPVWWFLLDGSLNILVSCWRFYLACWRSWHSCWRVVGGSTKKIEVLSSNLIERYPKRWLDEGVSLSSDNTPSCSWQMAWISNTDLHPCFWWLRTDEVKFEACWWPTDIHSSSIV